MRMTKNILLSIVGLAVVWFLTVSLPVWVARLDLDPLPLRLESLRFVGWIPILLGSSLLLWGYWLFNFIGRGTPWPFDPPKTLVVVGPYRFVRNPMQGGCLLVILGEALLFQSSGVILYSLVGFMALHLRLVIIEEPILRRRFGESYKEYCRTVPRWIPRWRRRSSEE